MTDAFPAVDTPDEFVDLKFPFERLSEAIRNKRAVEIVAMGSSSTAGRADVVPYPYRLEMYLRAHYNQLPGLSDLRIDVRNRGRGGQEAGDELERFKADIFDDDPSLVIWQVGTNAVFHKMDIRTVAAQINEGLGRLREKQLEVLLVDPQYVTAMLLDDTADASDLMVSLIADAAKDANINLFRRWALMRHWHVHNGVGLAQMLDPTDDANLHQNDWSTMLVSQALCKAIIRKVVVTA